MTDNFLITQADKLYDKAYSWVFSFGPRILVAILVLIIGEWLIRLLIKGLHRAMHRKSLDPSLRPFLDSLVQAAMQVLLVLAIIQIVGVQMTIFTALVGAFGVAAGLALSGTLQNFTSGILILLMKPYKIGDNIIGQGVEGTVTSIQIFNTVVTTYDNKTVIIPNSKLSNEVITNLSRQGNRRLDIELEFSYSIPPGQVKQAIKVSIDSIADVLKDPPYRLGISSLNKDTYKLLVNLWLPAHGFQDIKLQFQEKLMNDLMAAGIKLPGLEQ